MERKKDLELKSEAFQHLEVGRRQRSQQRKLRSRQKDGNKIMGRQHHGSQMKLMLQEER